MASAYILFLNPLILSGNSIGFPTGMPAEDVTLATTFSTGAATAVMGLVANYPWVVSTQLGTNVYFVNNVLIPFTPCGAHSTLTGDDQPCSRVACECTGDMTNPAEFTVLDSTAPLTCSTNTTNVCLGTKIPFEQALAATFLEGVIFFLICVAGLRFWFLKIVPKQILLAGACGIGIFISFVGFKDAGFITQSAYPTLLRLNLENQYNGGPVIDLTYHGGPVWNSCIMYYGGAPFGVQCNWLALGGLIFTGILLVWELNGALIAGILFTTFISWIIFPNKLDADPPGLVPSQFANVPSWSDTAGKLDFNWGDNTGRLVGALFTFLYLDFLGSAITFAAMGAMCGLLNDKGEIPRSNRAFMADAVGTMLGGLTGSSALTTYVESAAAVREGGRTGLTACVCAILFFLSCFFYPWTSQIPTIATGPVLILIGVIIFMSAVYEVDFKDMSNAIPSYMTMLVMPFTHNIAYGIIAGWIAWVISKVVTFQLTGFPLYQEKWGPGHSWYQKVMAKDRSMFVRIPGWNDHDDRSKKFDDDQAAKAVETGSIPDRNSLSISETSSKPKMDQDPSV